MAGCSVHTACGFTCCNPSVCSSRGYEIWGVADLSGDCLRGFPGISKPNQNKPKFFLFVHFASFGPVQAPVRPRLAKNLVSARRFDQQEGVTFGHCGETVMFESGKEVAAPKGVSCLLVPSHSVQLSAALTCYRCVGRPYHPQTAAAHSGAGAQGSSPSARTLGSGDRVKGKPST